MLVDQFTIKRARTLREQANGRGQTMATGVTEKYLSDVMSRLAKENPNIAGIYYAINNRTGKHYYSMHEVVPSHNPAKKNKRKKK